MTNPTDIGASISDSFRLVSAVATECEAMIMVAKEEVSRMLLEPEIKQMHTASGDWLTSYQEDDTGWLNTDLAASLELKPKRKSGRKGHLFIQISLVGIGVNALNNLEPLIHVGWWHDPIVFDETQMGFPIESDASYDLQLEDEVLFRWTHKAAPDEWCYTLRLTDVNSLKDVKDRVVAPLKALLLGQPASDVLGSLPAVRFSRVDGDSGQFTMKPR